MVGLVKEPPWTMRWQMNEIGGLKDCSSSWHKKWRKADSWESTESKSEVTGSLGEEWSW